MGDPPERRGELLRGEGEKQRRGELAINVRFGALDFDPSSVEQANAIGVRLSDLLYAARLGGRFDRGLCGGTFRADAAGLGLLDGLSPGVLSLLADELFLAACELDLRSERIFLDRPFFLDRESATREGRLVRFLLNFFARRCLECLFEIRARL